VPPLHAISRTVIRLFFQKSALRHGECTHRVQLLAELEHAVGSQLLYGKKKGKAIPVTGRGGP
jgi:hypothetical protein